MHRTYSPVGANTFHIYLPSGQCKTLKKLDHVEVFDPDGSVRTRVQVRETTASSAGALGDPLLHERQSESDTGDFSVMCYRGDGEPEEDGDGEGDGQDDATPPAA